MQAERVEKGTRATFSQTLPGWIEVASSISRDSLSGSRLDDGQPGMKQPGDFVALSQVTDLQSREALAGIQRNRLALAATPSVPLSKCEELSLADRKNLIN